MANLCSKNELSIDKLCVDCARMNCAKVQQVVADNVCSQVVWAKDLNVENGIANKLCVSGALQAKSVSTDVIGANSMCVKEGTINTLCVDNLSIGNFVPYIKYRATVNYSADVVYTLGTQLSFDNIVDDPNANVSLVPFTSYTAPASGYYSITLKVNVTDIQSLDQILGSPIGNPEVYVNGILVREIYTPFLAFLNSQKSIVSSLITLQAGDIVSMKYNVLGGNGVPIIGTASIQGAGIEDGNSLFKIIFLSGLTASEGAACVQCPTVDITCAPITTPCQPLVTPGGPNPCDSCMC